MKQIFTLNMRYYFREHWGPVVWFWFVSILVVGLPIIFVRDFRREDVIFMFESLVGLGVLCFGFLYMYMRIMKRNIYLEIDDRSLRFTDNLLNFKVLISLVQVISIHPYSLTARQILWYQLLKMPVLSYLFQRMEMSARLQSVFKRMEASGVDRYESWLTHHWLEIELKHGTQVIPLGSFDTHTRNEILKELRVYFTIQDRRRLQI